MAMAYYIQITEEDLEGLEKLKGPDGSNSFYAQYLQTYFADEKRRNEKVKIKKTESFMSTDPTILQKVKSEV